MSFFDEADEPEPTPRPETRRPRSVSRPRQQRSGRPPGGSGRPPGSQHPQDVQTRRLVAVGVIVVIVILLAVLVKSCSSSATTTSLKNYNASVYNLISASDSNGGHVFDNLTNGNLNSSTLLTTQASNANAQLSQAEHLSVPSQMAAPRMPTSTSAGSVTRRAARSSSCCAIRTSRPAGRLTTHRWVPPTCVCVSKTSTRSMSVSAVKM